MQVVSPTLKPAPQDVLSPLDKWVLQLPAPHCTSVRTKLVMFPGIIIVNL